MTLSSKRPERSEPAADFAGDPDGLERLWTPYRMAYIDDNNARKAASTNESSSAAGGSVTGEEDTPNAECPFCVAPGKSDEDALIVRRGEHCYVILNLYPYNPGHLLVCPYRHVPRYTDLTREERAEFGELTAAAMRVLDAAVTPAGHNLGMNQGRVAGAGIAEHLHQHIVPRWEGDANFFPLIARTKAIPQLLSDTRTKLANTWRDVAEVRTEKKEN